MRERSPSSLWRDAWPRLPGVAVAPLSFLGLGIRPPAPEWGTMLTDGREFLQLAPHVAIFLGVAIVITVSAVNLLGDGLRGVLDLRLRAG
jgi:ABC-type dipeptide/oligopeptide/nickel transport system permease subunit